MPTCNLLKRQSDANFKAAENERIYRDRMRERRSDEEYQATENERIYRDHMRERRRDEAKQAAEQQQQQQYREQNRWKKRVCDRKRYQTKEFKEQNGEEERNKMVEVFKTKTRPRSVGTRCCSKGSTARTDKKCRVFHRRCISYNATWTQLMSCRSVWS